MSAEYEKLKDVHTRQMQLCERSTVALSKARLRLYIVSITSIVVFVTNAMPTKIEPLGIDVSAFEAQRVLPILSLISAYFLVLYICREFQFRNARYSEKLAHVQLCEEAGHLTAAEWRKKVVDRGNFNFILGDVGGWVSTIVLTVTPVVLGIVASSLGFMPSEFGWLKTMLTGTTQ